MCEGPANIVTSSLASPAPSGAPWSRAPSATFSPAARRPCSYCTSSNCKSFCYQQQELVMAIEPFAAPYASWRACSKIQYKDRKRGVCIPQIKHGPLPPLPWTHLLPLLARWNTCKLLTRKVTRIPGVLCSNPCRPLSVCCLGPEFTEKYRCSHTPSFCETAKTTHLKSVDQKGDWGVQFTLLT